MKAPNTFTKFLGTPRVAAVLYFTCALTAWAWMDGKAPCWLALAALFFIGTVRKAVQDVRRYGEWLASWNAMGRAPAAGAPKAKPVSPWRGVITAGLYLVLIPMFIAAPEANEGLRSVLSLVWVGVAGYLLWKLGVLWRQRSAREPKAQNTDAIRKSSADVVRWLLPVASSSPSRAEAAGSVPGYCARLMGVR
jgi:hypothetical protein